MGGDSGLRKRLCARNMVGLGRVELVVRERIAIARILGRGCRFNLRCRHHPSSPLENYAFSCLSASKST